MQKPQIIQEVGFDFSWDEKKVWALDIPTEEMDTTELTWHFDVPFLWTKPAGYYDLKPQEVMDSPDKHADEYERTMSVDMSHPIDIMMWKGRWLILDGLHRLMKASVDGLDTVKIRKVDEKYIPYIKKNVILAALVIPYRSTADGYEFLLLQHENGTWTFTGGGMDPEDKTLEDCLAREIKEEIGFDVEKEDLQATGFVNSFTYDDKKPERAGKIGETHFYLLRLNGDEKFSSWDKVQDHGWFSAEKILELVPYNAEKEIFKNAIKLLD